MSWNAKHTNRRSVLSLLGAAVVAPRTAAAAVRPIETSAFSHAAIGCSNLPRSIEFYQRLLGLTLAADARNGFAPLLIGAGPERLELWQAGDSVPLGLFGYGLTTPKFEIRDLTSQLKGLGVPSAKSRRSLPPSVSISDADAIEIEVRPATTAGAVSPVGAAIEPLSINHFTLTVADLKQALSFYQRVFGLPLQTSQAEAPLLGVGTGHSPLRPAIALSAGTKVGINHVCLGVAKFEPGRIMSQLHKLGLASAETLAPKDPLTATIRWRQAKNNGGGPDAPLGTPELYFSDPDNTIIQLQDVTYCGGRGPIGNICSV